MNSLIFSSFNLFVLVGILVYKLRQPIREMVTQRHHFIKTEIQTVQIQLKEAQEKYDEFSAKLKAIDAEVLTLKEQAKQDLQAVKQKVIAEARKSSTQVVADARVTADHLYSELKGQLYSELSQKVLDKAEGLLREKLTGDDRARMRQEFSQQLGSVQ